MRPCSTESAKRSSPAKPLAIASTSHGMASWPTTVKSEQHEAEPGERVAGEALGVLAGLDLLGEHRHEGEVEGALGEEAAEHVRQREGDQERLRHRPGAEQRRHQDVAREARARGETIVQEPTLRKAGRSRIGRFNAAPRRPAR